MKDFRIELIKDTDRQWIKKLMIEHWGGETVVSRGRVHYPENLPGFIAWQEDRRVGLATYRLDDEECELVTLDSLVEGIGIGGGLIEAVKISALREGCTRLWLITTNDNLHGLGFYQKRGFQIAAVHINALERSRQIKPSIPTVGMHGIPIRDEIELEIMLDDR